MQVGSDERGPCANGHAGTDSDGAGTTAGRASIEILDEGVPIAMADPLPAEPLPAEPMPMPALSLDTPTPLPAEPVPVPLPEPVVLSHPEPAHIPPPAPAPIPRPLQSPLLPHRRLHLSPLHLLPHRHPLRPLRRCRRALYHSCSFFAAKSEM